jgi:E3 ubiquitin-protein ligase Topors
MVLFQFLTTFILSLMKSIDIRSESAVKLLAEFLDMDTEYVEGARHVNAEHFAHGSFLYPVNFFFFAHYLCNI